MPDVSIIMDWKFWHFDNRLNLQFELVYWRCFLATETKSKQYFNLIRKDWVLVYWNWQKLLISIHNLRS